MPRVKSQIVLSHTFPLKASLKLVLPSSVVGGNTRIRNERITPATDNPMGSVFELKDSCAAMNVNGIFVA